MPAILLVLAGIAPGALLNSPATLAEELCWRDFLHNELAPLGPLKTSLITGVMWGMWPAPLILHGLQFPTHSVAGNFVMIAGCSAISPIMIFLRMRSGTIPAAVLFHCALNVGGPAPMAAVEGHPLVSPSLGLLGLLAGATLAVPLVWAWRRPRLSR